MTDHEIHIAILAARKIFPRAASLAIVEGIEDELAILDGRMLIVGFVRIDSCGVPEVRPLHNAPAVLN